MGGRKYFKGRVKGTEVWLGTFGNRGGELSLKNAREKYFEIKDFCQKNEVSYAEYKREKLSEWTLKDAIDHCLKECSKRIKQTTYREYDRKLNQVLTLIDGSTPIKELEWVIGGKERIEEVISKIENGGKGRNYDLARRCRNLLKQVFDGAIFKGKFTRGQNPASIEGRVIYIHRESHHPHLEWEEVPEFLEKVSLNSCNSHPFAQMATKFMLMSFLRAGALTRLKWDWIDWDKKLLTIDGTTSGLKRNKEVNDDKSLILDERREFLNKWCDLLVKNGLEI